MPINKTQILVIVGSISLIVLLLFANTKLPKKENSMPAMSDHAGEKKADINMLVEQAENALTSDQKSAFGKLKEGLKSSSNQQKSFESIINKWDSIRQPAIAAYYMEQAAIASSNEVNWKQAGDRYYTATRFVKDEAIKPILFSKAIECFQKTLELNPNNVEVKISLASCYVEGSGEPMKGIGMLRDIEKTDSNNVNLQLSFAFFSEKSGQWDRAIARFKKVLKIQPNFIEAYLHLADAYEQKGDRAKAIESLEKYITLVDDIAIKTEIQNYINKLKN
jgi:tetratricopeptide (TPR) repeat protein